jgi:hypothetical protein
LYVTFYRTCKSAYTRLVFTRKMSICVFLLKYLSALRLSRSENANNSKMNSLILISTFPFCSSKPGLPIGVAKRAGGRCPHRYVENFFLYSFKFYGAGAVFAVWLSACVVALRLKSKKSLKRSCFFLKKYVSGPPIAKSWLRLWGYLQKKGSHEIRLSSRLISRSFA